MFGVFKKITRKPHLVFFIGEEPQRKFSPYEGELEGVKKTTKQTPPNLPS
jgi:hypothetical protein